MQRPPRLLTSACAAGLLALAIAPLGARPAAAEDSDGTIYVVAVQDTNGNGEYDKGIDEAQPDIDITVTDVSGHTATGTTDDQGEYVVKADPELKGGRYFVVAEVPGSLGLDAVPPSDTFQALSTTVDVTSEDQTVVFGFAGAAPASETPTAEATPEVQDPPPPDPAEPDPTEAPEPAAESAPRFAVGDRVWNDTNRQGVQDGGEGPAAKTSVQLLDAGGAVVDSTVTDDGHYVFDDLPAGVYSVRFSGIPAQSRLSPTGAGSAATDSDPDYTGVTPPFTLDVGAPNMRAAAGGDHVDADYINPTVDAGIAPLRYAVAASVWQDTSGDGVQQAGEPAGQARVSLLRSGSTTPVATVTTDAGGRWRFEDLEDGTYRLRFDELGAHRQLTVAHVGSNRAVDSDPDPRTGTTPTFTLGPSSTDLVPARDFGPVNADFVDTTLNAGVIGRYEIRNRVWEDTNGDGLVSPGESGIPGVQVQVLDASGIVVATTRTDGEGVYSFTSLPAGSYRLRLRGVPPGLHPTAPGVGGDRTTDSDVYADSRTAPIALGEDHPVEDAVGLGLTRTATVAQTKAPATAPPTTGAAAPAVVLAGDEDVSTLVPALGSGLLLAGGAMIWLARRRRR